jgi:hypothetical protein
MHSSYRLQLEVPVNYLRMATIKKRYCKLQAVAGMHLSLLREIIRLKLIL